MDRPYQTSFSDDDYSQSRLECFGNSLCGLFDQEFVLLAEGDREFDAQVGPSNQTNFSMLSGADIAVAMV